MCREAQKTKQKRYGYKKNKKTNKRRRNTEMIENITR